MKKVSFSKRLRYKFDNLMSKGAGVLLLSLGCVTAAVIIVVAIVVSATRANPSDFPTLLWMGLMHTIDSGNISGDTGSLYILLMFIVTLCGIFILSILIGILTTGIQAKLDSLRRGRSGVIEKDQTVILGWSERIFPILQELIEANSNRKHACVVVMGNRDKSEMDSEIRERFPRSGTTRIVTRQGNPIDVDDLEIVSLNTSRSIIILPEDDTSVIKTILAITNNPNRRSKPYHIVTMLKDPKYLDVAKIAGKDQVEIILCESFISRIIAQTCRQPGLSTVYTELLDFGGDEIYFANCPETTGKTFADTLMMFGKSSIIGICSDGVASLNPPMGTVLKPGDEVIAISEDDDTVTVSAMPQSAIDEEAIVKNPAAPSPAPEKTLILGWNSSASQIICEMDNYVAEGSLVTAVSVHANSEALAPSRKLVRRQTIEAIEEDPKNRELLESLLSKGYNHVILLNGSEDPEIDNDSATLVTLLYLRDIAEKNGYRFSVVSEMTDFRNKKLAEATKVNDFIVSDKLVSLMLTQVSENKRVNAVLQDIFDADGSEIYVKPVTDYVLAGRAVNFYTVMEAARRKGEVAIGYIKSAEQSNAANNYGIRINPKKSDQVTFADGDSLIVVAEE